MPIDEATLNQYALGILDEHEMQKVQEEIATSPELQHELDAIQLALSQIAMAETPVLPNAGLRTTVLDSIKEETRFNGFIDRFSSLFDLDQSASAKLLAKIDAVSGNEWESVLFPGVDIMKFSGGPSVASATCGIVQVKSGKLFPAHQHQGDEQILVLAGSARDDHNREFNAGDSCLFQSGSRHSFRITSNEPFVFAVVLYRKNKWLFWKTIVDSLRINKS